MTSNEKLQNSVSSFNEQQDRQLKWRADLFNYQEHAILTPSVILDSCCLIIVFDVEDIYWVVV